MIESERLRYIQAVEDGRHKFLVELPGVEKGLEVTCGWSTIDVPAKADPAKVASAYAASVGVSVAANVRAYLPTSFENASKAALDGQASRIGALIGRWFYDYIYAGVQAAYADQS